MGKGGSALSAASVQLYETPRWFLDAVRKRFNVRFTLDVAADRFNAVVPTRYYDERSNAFTLHWDAECVWCNPPWKAPTPWVEKALEERTRFTHCFLLLPARTETKWFSRAFHVADTYFIHPRMNYCLDGEEQKGIAIGSVLFHFHPGNVARRTCEIWPARRWHG
jgi:phage N-6-adenine-methyltransferase